MNIFRLSNDSKQSAMWDCDRYMKIVLESVSMLSTAHRVLDGERIETLNSAGRKHVIYSHDNDILYKSNHVNHPSSKWVRESKDNYRWLYDLFVYLTEVNVLRYGRMHGSYVKLSKTLQVAPSSIPDIGETVIPLAMKSHPECMYHDDPIKSYREFYKTKRENFNMVWTNRDVPYWFLTS